MLRPVLTHCSGSTALDGIRSAANSNVPDNITLFKLPPYSPELNPVENVRQYLRQNQLSNRVFQSYDVIVDACCVLGTRLSQSQAASNQ